MAYSYRNAPYNNTEGQLDCLNLGIFLFSNGAGRHYFRLRHG